MSRLAGNKLEFNHELLRGSAIKDPYGNTTTLMVLYYTGPGDNRYAFYVQGDMYEPGDIRQFIIMAPDQAGAIHAYDEQLQREHKLAGKARYDLLAKEPREVPWPLPATFAQWWAAQPNGTCWFSGRNFTPDVCIQLTA